MLALVTLCPPRSVLQTSLSCSVLWLHPGSIIFQFPAGFTQWEMPVGEERVEDGREVRVFISVLFLLVQGLAVAFSLTSGLRPC